MSKATSRDSKGGAGSAASSKGKSHSSQGSSQRSENRNASSQQGSFVLQSVPSASTNQNALPADPRATEWKNFFLDSGIPDHAASEYATIFVKERINWPILKNLDKGYLTDMGINTIGDQISILQAAKRYCGEQYTPGGGGGPPPVSTGVMRMETDESVPIAANKQQRVLSQVKKREIEKPEITSSSTVGGRKVGKNEVSSTTAVRSIVKSTSNPGSATVLVRPKRPYEDADAKETSMVKRLSALPPRQIRQPSPNDVNFTVRMGPGPGTKRDVFSRLTPKGVKTTGNTNLVRVLESKMSRLSTGPPAVTRVTSEVDKPTLVSDSLNSLSPVFNRLGSSSGRARSIPSSRLGSASGSTVFSRLGIQSGGTKSHEILAGGDLRQRLAIKDRLGFRS